MSVHGVLGRTVGALLSLGVVAAATMAGTVAGQLGPRQPAGDATVDVAVPTARTTLVCPGPPRLPTEPQEGGDVAYDPQFDPAPEGTATSLSAATVDRADGAAAVPLAVGPLGAAATQEVDAAGGGATTRLEPTTGTVLTADPADGPAAWVAGSVVSRTTAGDLRGLVAGTCRAPSAETWLVGGGTAVGMSARLVLQNPGTTPALVRLELWGAGGAAELAGTPEYLVPAGSERAVLLEGVAAGQERLVARVTSTGGLVTAYLQDSALRGLTPAGVDLVVAGTGPATRQVVTGVSVPGGASGADVAVLRLLAPGAGGTASVTVLGPDGEVALPGTDALALEADGVIDVPLDGLPEGDHTLVVTADVPVVAGVMLTAGRGVGATEPSRTLPLDRAWLPAVEPGTSAPLGLAAGADWRLVLADVGDGADVEVTVLGADGDVATVTRDLPAGRTVSLTPADLGVDGDATALVVRTDAAEVAWSVVLGTRRSDGDLVAVLTPAPAAAVRTSVPVRLH